MKKKDSFVFLLKINVIGGKKNRAIYALHEFGKVSNSNDDPEKPRLISDDMLYELRNEDRDYWRVIDMLVGRTDDDDEYVVNLNKNLPREFFTSRSRALMMASVLGIQVYEFKKNGLPEKMTFKEIRTNAKLAK